LNSREEGTGKERKRKTRGGRWVGMIVEEKGKESKQEEHGRKVSK
jgi:hypothetical protein